FNLEKTDLLNRLTQIYGTNYSDELLEVVHETELISVRGYIAKPSFTKKNKQEQVLYLNNRYVISKALSYAVHLAYDDLIEKGDYPNFFLFLKLNPRTFDINVHPSKLEVKFEEEKALFSFMRRAVIDCLSKNDLV